MGWLTFLWPPLANRALPVILPVGLLAALAQIAWFIIVGVNEERWKEQATASRRASLEER